MKSNKIFVLLAIAIIMSLTSNAVSKQKIEPLLGSRFGELLTVEGRFIEKPNTYFAQNVIKQPYLFMITAVNGKPLSKPIAIEYQLSKKQKIIAGKVYRFKAYETIYPFGSPRGWSKLMHQFNYEIHHRLILK